VIWPKKVKRPSSKDARFYSGKTNIFGKLSFFLGFKYKKAPKITPPSLATEISK